MRQLLILPLAMLLLSVTACSEPDRPSISLYLAVQRGDLDQLERHIHWGTDINSVLPNGQYPLHVAAEKGRIVMVKTLLKYDAAIDPVDAAGETALGLAILAGRTQIAEILLGAGARLDASQLLLKAADTDVTDRDTLRFLIAHGADTEQRNADGDTALLIAIRRDNHRLAAHLVREGAAVNVQGADGRSALALARDLGFAELIQLLERNGAS